MNKTIKELMNLKGRVALITGGAGHIGNASAEALAELGADLVLVDREQESLDELCQRLVKEYPIKVVPIVVDLENEESCKKIFEIVHHHFDRLDILINNAAFVGTSDLKGWIDNFENQRIDTWERALKVNLTAPFALVQKFEKLLARSSHGTVINIGSIYGVIGPDMTIYEGLVGMGNPGAYAASKGGLIQLTRWLASVLAPKVRVNAISPGGLLRGQPEEFCCRYKEKTLLNRMACESDLKGAIIYLASDLSSYVTGHNLLVDGGWTAV